MFSNKLVTSNPLVAINRPKIQQLTRKTSQEVIRTPFPQEFSGGQV